MEHDLISNPRDGREPVRDARVLQAMRCVPRHLFIPDSSEQDAYADVPQSIGHGQTISQPYIVALMTQLLNVQPGQKVLEIGTGSGYQTAILAQLTDQVYSVEIIAPLHEQARQRLQQLNCQHVHLRLGDGHQGWPEHAPYDAIIVTCAADPLPPPLWQQLKPSGRMVIPLGAAHSAQQLFVFEKDAHGNRRNRETIPVRFVPMTRDETSRE
ncbi:MAG: protein-L-isoaspartate(D-aspartate) O-methyltransferase [Phycisphaeraceae bacterium]|nr:protein-L-isoaspartate(D-aspartate) O-methyltransferase [Phycisphaeraceae bacterium]